jgi:hypothetical protein
MLVNCFEYKPHSNGETQGLETRIFFRALKIGTALAIIW